MLRFAHLQLLRVGLKENNDGRLLAMTFLLSNSLHAYSMFAGLYGQMGAGYAGATVRTTIVTVGSGTDGFRFTGID